MASKLSAVGKRLPLKDAYEKVTGNLQFAVDFTLPGMLYGKILRSPYAHAKIVRIDVTKAQLLKGVEAVITYKDVHREEWMERSFNYRGPVLDERARFAGDEVAAVVAIDKFIAEEALGLIEVEYEVLPHVFDLERAMEPDAPQVTPHGNVRPPSIIEWGETEKGFAEADLIVEHKTKSGNQQHASIGRNACIAKWEGNKLIIWTSTQTPFQLRDELARFLNMPQCNVRVVAMPTGASFGLWWSNNFHFIAVFLAKKAKKPVKIDLTQEECFATVKRRDTAVSYGKLGLKRDGTFTAIHFKHYFDNGAYGFKSYPYESVADLWGSTPHGLFEMYGISNNLLTAGCMRGVGDLTMNFCVEQLIDKAAEELKMDPLEIRLRNHIRAGDRIRSLNRMYKAFKLPAPDITLSSCGLDECITKGAEAIGWKEKWKGWRKPTEVKGTKIRSVGMAVSAHICGGRHLGCPSVIVKLNNDGSVHLLTGVGRMGQGVETTQAQLVSEELGIPVESIAFIQVDTETSPWSPPTVACVNAHQTGLATQAAAADAKRQLCELASNALGVEPTDLDIKEGRIFIKGQPEKGIRVTSITSKILPETLSLPSIIGRASKNVPTSPMAKIFAAYFVELEVDTETGEVTILKVVTANDSGKIINPEVCENQVYGGVIMGCGYSLIEDLVFDKETGRVLNDNFLDYKIFTALDVPIIEPTFIEIIDPVGPFGVKGIGEITAAPVPAAIAQAIYNAIGIRLDVPFTPERILEHLKQQTKAGQ